MVKRSSSAEAGLVGKKAGDADGIAGATAAAAEELDPQGDRWAEAAYRKLLIQNLGRDVITTAFARAAGGAA